MKFKDMGGGAGSMSANRCSCTCRSMSQICGSLLPSVFQKVKNYPLRSKGNIQYGDLKFCRTVSLSAVAK